MADFVDEFGVPWTIQQNGAEWVATVNVAEHPDPPYNPIITTSTRERALEAVQRNAQEHRKKLGLRVGAPPPNTGGAGNVGSIIIIIGGLWLLFAKKSPVSFRRVGFADRWPLLSGRRRG